MKKVLAPMADGMKEIQQLYGLDLVKTFRAKKLKEVERKI